jgi:UDP-2-acetamido-3-amino-2,3-dideoxy-glucuronate N-acetyltransferase
MQTEYEIITGQNIKRLENGAVINRYSHIVKGAEIGVNVMIGSFCYVARTATIGDDTRIQNNVSVFDGVVIGKGVFIGPNVTFTNHHDPRDIVEREEKGEFIPDKTYIGHGVIICAGVVIVAPCRIGKGARVGAGSVVLANIKAGETKNGIIKGDCHENKIKSVNEPIKVLVKADESGRILINENVLKITKDLAESTTPKKRGRPARKK